ncbi:ribbon-helix-helix domain-containing protein [Candidatus Bathyarchaeota archaeon]|nr:ribbon-helix-helix domain-containing protein [Candidatus Bathyarchaeota archaeon]
MVKVKTSIYVDKDLWRSFKEYSSKSGIEVSRMLEELIKDAIIEVELNRAFTEMGGGYEIDFDPVEPKGPVSSFIRVMRDERANSVFRQ